MLGEWRPDLPEHGHNGLVEATNVLPSQIGYEPIKTPSAITAALPEAWAGGGAFVGLDGSSTLVAGTAAGLYSYASGAWGSKYVVASSQPWFFDQFGDNVIGVNGGAPVKLTLSSSTGALLGGTPPSSSMIAIVRDFVFLAGNSSAVSTVTWSAINNAEGWTIGTDQCDEQLIPDGGAITGLAGGEYGLVFQNNAIHLFEYVGVPLIFTRRKVSDSIGAMCHGSIAQAGGTTFFYSRRGFFSITEGQIAAIGEAKVDRTFADLYSTSDIENNMRATVDPERSLVIWSMPDRLWIYNWDLKRWSVIAVPGIVGISNGRTASVTLDQIAVTFPSIEDVTPVLDDPVWRGGEPMLLIAKTDNKLYSFSSTQNLAATLRQTKVRLFPWHRAHLRRVQIIGDVGEVTVNIDHAFRVADTMSRVTATSVRANGDIPIRASGHYFQPEIRIGDGVEWTFIENIELDAVKGGRQ